MARTVLIVCAAVLAGATTLAGASAVTDADDPGRRPAVAAPAGGPAPPAPREVRYSSPVLPLRVVRPFDPPESDYGPGHLGADLATVSAAAVYSAADGVVSFSGSVAGRGLVVVRHVDGISTEYEPLRPAVRTGDPVRAGEVLGRVHGRHGACATDGCLHWGARRGPRRPGAYLDPLLLLTPLGPVRLLPWQTTARP